MGLTEYNKKRDFRKTPEPSADTGDDFKGFVVQKHDASRLHYDFRLAFDDGSGGGSGGGGGGVLWSWAVPKGPSLNPADKRLAVRTEDHPLAYAGFEGVIPEGEYGGGAVLLWDRGDWEPVGDPAEGMAAGSLKFELRGEKLRGRWALVQMKGKRSDGGKNWLLIKDRDDHADRDADITDDRPESVKTGRSIEDVAADRDAVWGDDDDEEGPRAEAHSAEGLGLGDILGDIKGAKRGRPPKTIKPQLATLVEAAPGGDDWVHEIKYDGYRLLCVIDGGEVRLKTRNDKDWTGRFPSIARAAAGLPVGQAVIDGEAVVLDDEGRSHFQWLQNALKQRDRGAIHFYAFDLPYCGGFDLTGASLEDRKAALRKLLAEPDAGTIRYSDHLDGRGPDFWETACDRQLEGIICKKRGARYAHGRSKTWLKVKCIRRQEFIIAGYTDPGGSRVGFGALALAEHTDDGLVYAGRVGTGFDDDLLRSLRKRLEPRGRKTSPLDIDPPRGEVKGVHWVTPELVGEVSYTERTGDGRLRHPAFLGLREDKPADDVQRERPVRVTGNGQGSGGGSGGGGGDTFAGITLSNPDRVLYPEMGLTKRDLAAYYAVLADHVLPHVVDRPLSVVRCPKGRGGKCFYQKHANDTVPDTVHGVDVSQAGEDEERHLYIDDLTGLVSLVQLGVLEVHPWGCRVDRLDRPDLLTFDLDPDEGLAWPRVVEATRTLRGRLEALGLHPLLKTSGGKGLHVVVPIQRYTGWDDAKAFAKAVVSKMARDEPKKYTAVMSKAKRKGRVFLDYLRNGRGATAVAAYSTRARRGAPVAAPLRWDELSDGLSPNQYTVKNLRQRLASLEGDPWPDLGDAAVRITKRMMNDAGV